MKIICIIVTYNPDVGKLNQLVRNIESAQSDYVIVDNSENNVELEVNAIKLGANHGIAYAQNVGIHHCITEKADVIIFLDQDSVIDGGVINGLVAALEEGDADVVAPIYVDSEKGFTYPVVRISKWGVRHKIVPRPGDEPFFTNVVISSGTAARPAVFKAVGVMREDLFIDYVDTEWCLRYCSYGYRIKVLPNVLMAHSIGESSINLYLLRVPVHSPYRRYYRIRNSFHLLRAPHVPKLMAIREVVFSVLHQLILAVYASERRGYLSYMTRGIVDGCKGKTGKLEL